MRKLLTGYATGYNRRHKRHGHLFQNRYKSIVCEEEPYFLRLVSYIHLNPLRAGLAESLEDLERYPWSGHAVVMNRIRHEWQDRNYVLGYFGQRESSARKAYQEFFAKERGRGESSRNVLCRSGAIAQDFSRCGKPDCKTQWVVSLYSYERPLLTYDDVIFIYLLMCF